MKNKIEKHLEAFLSLYKQQNLVERNISVFLKKINLTFQQFLFLYLIDKLINENGEANSIEIRKKMGIAMAAISRLGSRIENLKMVKRKVEVGKIVTYELTDKGKKVLDNGLELYFKTNNKIANLKINKINNIIKELENISELY